MSRLNAILTIEINAYRIRRPGTIRYECTCGYAT
jgi:hypothetical protein